VENRSTIIVPGAFTSAPITSRTLGSPATPVALTSIHPARLLSSARNHAGVRTHSDSDADVAEVANAIVKVVDMPFGKRPFRVHVDPANDGAEVVNGVADRVRAELLRNMSPVIYCVQVQLRRKGRRTSRFRRTSAVSVEIHVPEVVAEQPSRFVARDACLKSALREKTHRRFRV